MRLETEYWRTVSALDSIGGRQAADFLDYSDGEVRIIFGSMCIERMDSVR